ncbi:MAG: VapC toxin family PIN domain ribonuclease [Candidatus Angelobacter sp. Gp1-AA117]|nr:MAG: VapC toxin family PIN domain ribonuclease [Candidatus Angelobacter sp. Gp1-AA117]
MNGQYLLDTNIVIAVLENDHSLSQIFLPGSSYFLPCIVVGELYFGAFNSGRVQHNINRIKSLVKAVPVLPCDLNTSYSYGEIMALLRKKGKPIPSNDIWIAAIAHQQKLTLLTRDKHFKEVDIIRSSVV